MKLTVSLQTRFVLLFAFLILLLTIIISITIGVRSSENVKEEIGHSLAETAYQMADKLDQYMWARAGEITVLSNLDTIRQQENVEGAQFLLDRLKTSFPSFSWIGLTDDTGRVLSATDGVLKGADISKRPVYTEGRKGAFIGDVHDAVLLAKLLPNPSGEPMKFVDISTPVVGNDGVVKGVLAAHLSWAWVAEMEASVMEPLKKRKNLEIFIVSYQDGTILLGPKDMIGQQLSIDSVTLARSGENNWRVEKWPDGKEYLTGHAFGKGYQNYPGLGWSVLVRQPVEIAFVPVQNLQYFILLIGGFFAIIFAGLGWFLAKSISKPLQDVTKAADKLRFGGKIDLPEHRGITEIEILTASFRELSDSLTSTENELGKMKLLAHSDRLTGLPNRIGLDMFIEQAAAAAQRCEHTLVFLYLDLDGFKAVNDSLGHHAGDVLLQEVAGRLTNSIRGEEIAARLGGDEFLIVLYAETEKAHQIAGRIAQRIIKALNIPYIIEGKTVKIGCSIGGAMWPQDNKDIIRVINLADEALYRAKRSGKNKMVLVQKQPEIDAIS